ncbi:MAG: sigma-70 family RNA polymerase sigma factor [Desulfobacterales bacterium]
MADQSNLNPESWVDQYGDMLFKFAYSRVGNADVAEELVQDTFLAAIRAKDKFEGRSTEKTWLYSILKHKIIDHFRNTKKYATKMNDENYTEIMDQFFDKHGNWSLPMRPAKWNINPIEAYEQKEFLDVFFQCLSEVPERLANAFIYREIDGLSTEEICKVLNITTSNFWVMIYRARILLRRCIDISWIKVSE